MNGILRLSRAGWQRRMAPARKAGWQRTARRHRIVSDGAATPREQAERQRRSLIQHFTFRQVSS